MKFDPDMHHRHSIRLREYDYAAVGAYFVTVCIQGRECLLGAIEDGEMVLNAGGEMVVDLWRTLPERFPGCELDEFVAMPNHFHGVLWIVGAPLVGAQSDHLQTQPRARTRPAPTLGDIMGAFKSLTTNAYIRGVNEYGWPPFINRFWQRNFYERVIRDDDELTAIRAYIRDNPGQWSEDAENPAKTGALLAARPNP